MSGYDTERRRTTGERIRNPAMIARLSKGNSTSSVATWSGAQHAGVRRLHAIAAELPDGRFGRDELLTAARAFESAYDWIWAQGKNAEDDVPREVVE